MVQLTQITTRSGDKGKTSLGNGQRVFKNTTRIDLIGTIDELNSIIGVALSVKQNDGQSHENDTTLIHDLRSIQHDLFDMGADLCMPQSLSDTGNGNLRITEHHVHRLDAMVEFYNNKLSPLTSFVLPGGTERAAYLHMCRTIARRAERCLVDLHTQEPVNPEILRYTNRLSDIFFVMARAANNNGTCDILWEPGKYHGGS